MSTSTRLFALIQEIKARPGQTAKQLAAKFQRSERTIQRDIDQKFPTLGVVCVNRRGYRFELDPHLKPLALTSEEIVSVILAEQVAEKHLDVPTRKALKTAVDKLRRQFCSQDQLTATKLEERTAVAPGPQTQSDLAQQTMPQLTEAISRQQVVSFDYQGRDDKEPESRTAEPLGLFFQEGRWYLHAYDVNRQGIRTFRLGRMSKLQLSSKRFEAKAKFNADLAAFHEWDISDGEPVEFTLQLSTGLARWFEENKPHPSVKVAGQIATLSVTDPAAFLRWFASLDGAELLTPAHYRSHFIKRLHSLISQYRT